MATTFPQFRLARKEKIPGSELIVYHCVLASTSGGAAGGEIRIPGRRIKQVVVLPETLTPSNSWTLTLKDVDGVDILGGAGTMTTAANKYAFQAKVGGALHEAGVLVDGALVLAAAGMGDKKQASVKIYTEPAHVDDDYGT